MSNRTAIVALSVIMVLTLVWMAALVLIFGWMPAEDSTLAPIVDAPFHFVVGVSALLTIGVVVTIAIFTYKFRRRGSNPIAEPVYGNPMIEATWIVVPTILVLVIFTWGFKAFMAVTQPPNNAYEIRVTAHQWAWEFEYPNGHQSTNELVVPSNRPIKMIMTSTDVIHSFYVPAFRVKHDVIPNRYSTVWFNATKETGPPTDNPNGYIQIFCAEYCGTGHSNMLAHLWVLAQDDFNNWLDSAGTAGAALPLPELGKQTYNQKACSGCHSIDGSAGVGPTFKGIFGSTVQLADGTSVKVDENYIRESIAVPAAKVVKGFNPVMPPIPLTDRQVDGLVEFIKSLK